MCVGGGGRGALERTVVNYFCSNFYTHRADSLCVDYQPLWQSQPQEVNLSNTITCTARTKQFYLLHLPCQCNNPSNCRWCGSGAEASALTAEVRNIVNDPGCVSSCTVQHAAPVQNICCSCGCGPFTLMCTAFGFACVPDFCCRNCCATDVEQCISKTLFSRCLIFLLQCL